MATKELLVEVAGVMESTLKIVTTVNTLFFVLSHSLLQEFDLFSLGFFPKNGLICSNL